MRSLEIFQSMKSFAKYCCENLDHKLYGNSDFTLFVRDIGEDFIQITKSGPNQQSLPIVENDERRNSTFTILFQDYINNLEKPSYWDLAVEELTPTTNYSPELTDEISDFIPVKEDLRIRETREQVIRPGQREFRVKLLEIYSNKCAVSSTSVESVLEAAHIIPYNGDHSNHLQNGIMLRRDIHKLFDTYRLSINPDDYCISVEPNLVNSEYSIYHTEQLYLPDDVRLIPSRKALHLHFEKHLSLFFNE